MCIPAVHCVYVSIYNVWLDVSIYLVHILCLENLTKWLCLDRTYTANESVETYTGPSLAHIDVQWKMFIFLEFHLFPLLVNYIEALKLE